MALRVAKHLFGANASSKTFEGVPSNVVKALAVSYGISHKDGKRIEEARNKLLDLIGQKYYNEIDTLDQNYVRDFDKSLKIFTECELKKIIKNIDTVEGFNYVKYLINAGNNLNKVIENMGARMIVPRGQNEKPSINATIAKNILKKLASVKKCLLQVTKKGPCKKIEKDDYVIPWKETDPTKGKKYPFQLVNKKKRVIKTQAQLVAPSSSSSNSFSNWIMGGMGGGSSDRAENEQLKKQVEDLQEKLRVIRESAENMSANQKQKNEIADNVDDAEAELEKLLNLPSAPSRSENKMDEDVQLFNELAILVEDTKNKIDNGDAHGAVSASNETKQVAQEIVNTVQQEERKEELELSDDDPLALMDEAVMELGQIDDVDAYNELDDEVGAMDLGNFNKDALEGNHKSDVILSKIKTLKMMHRKNPKDLSNEFISPWINRLITAYRLTKELEDVNRDSKNLDEEQNLLRTKL